MNLPPAFVNNVTQAFGDLGRRYLATLPDLLIEVAHRWDLTLGKPFLLSYNYVCAVTRADGTPAVLKIGVPNRELTSEIKALRVYAGQGACQLLEADADQGLLLLERLQPGRMLVTLKDDERATEIAAQVMQAIQRPLPKGNGFISLRGWFDELKGLRPRFGGGTGPFPEKTVELVEGLVHDLFSENRPQVLLHGDFHHFNILLSERGWLVIDPKGVAGPAEYEVGPLLLNPWDQMPDEIEAIQRTQRRIGILSERLGFDRQRLWQWAICHSLLSAWWDLVEDGSGGEYSRAWTEIFLKTRI
ncbi:MAG TPA: aminoglycoside phosphotransferase family protein [Anaerolineales bacterium]